MFDRYGRAFAALAFGSALVVCTLVATGSFERARRDDTIQVTGSAKRRIRSDLIKWSATVNARGTDLKATYRTVSQSTPKLLAFLDKHGVPKAQVVVSSVSTETLHPHDKEGRELADVVSGYTLSQSVEVTSRDVDKVAEVSRQVTELLEEGVDLTSSAPEYHYTRLADLKIQMLAEAAADAHQRAQQIATSTHAKIGALRAARMGVIQINPADSTETSNEGNNDTSSLDKDIISVVSCTFALR